MTTRGEVAFGLGQFGIMLAELEGQMDLTPEELCLLGRAELRCARYDAAELHLLRASLLGVQVAATEYAEVLYETGRSTEAARWLHSFMPALHGFIPTLPSAAPELPGGPSGLHAARARHLLVRMALDPAAAGVSLDLLAEQAQAVAQLFLAQGEEEEAGQVAVTLAEISLLGGDLSRAERLLRVAMTVLNTAPDPGPRGRALLLLAWSLDLRGDDLGVQAALGELEALLLLEGTVRTRLAWMLLLCERHVLRSEWALLEPQLQAALVLATSLRDPGALGRLHLLRADALMAAQTGADSLDADHTGADVPASVAPNRHSASQIDRHVGVIAELARVPLQGAQLWAAEGRAALQRRDLAQAEHRLEAAREQFARLGRPLDELGARLGLAACHAAAGEPAKVSAQLQDALPRLLRLQERRSLRALVESHHALLEEASHDVRLAPYVQAVMQAADTLSRKAAPLLVVTLGDQRVTRQGQTLPLRAAIPLLVFLHMQPGSTRHEVQLALYPDRAPGAALSAVKLAMHALRRELGAEAVVVSGPYRDRRYRLSADLPLHLDTAALDQALWMQDVSRALHLYAGPFLPHHEGGEWLQEQRAARLAGLKQLVWARTEYGLRLGDWANAQLICQGFMRRDPADQDAPAWLEKIQERSALPVR